MQVQTLASTTLQSAYIAMMNAFSDYMVPIKMTQPQFEMKLRRDNVVADISPMAMLNGQIVGFNLFGLAEWNGKLTAYDAATGVIPSARGNNITAKLFEQTLPKLKEMEVEQCLLEVIIGNDVAHHIYQKMGFEQVRELICYSGQPQDVHKLPEGFSYVSVSDFDFNKVRAWNDWQPSWQNSDFASRNIINHYQIVGVVKDGEVVAYALLIQETGYIAQFAVDPKYRRMGIGSKLFSFLPELIQKPIHCINIDANDKGTNDFMHKIGMKETVRQYEMIMPLK